MALSRHPRNEGHSMPLKGSPVLPGCCTRGGKGVCQGLELSWAPLCGQSLSCSRHELGCF